MNEKPASRMVFRAWLALAVLAATLAGGEAATCTPGFIRLDLLSTNSTTCDASPHALCLASFEAGLGADCKLALTPLNGSGVYVPGIWSTHAAGTYRRPVQCPTSPSVAVDPDTPLTPATLAAALKTALQRHVYGAALELGVADVAFANGTVTVVTSGGGCALKYAITQALPADNNFTAAIGSDAAPAVCGADGGLLDGDECQANLSDNCPAGRRPVALPDGGKACPRCRAGTYSVSGKGCVTCAAGKFVGSVGASACASSCTAGSYSAGGNSECLPCPAGTYAANTGQGTCDACPFRSYARLPGATLCVRCVAGVAVCVAGKLGNGTACTDDFSAPSPGYHVLSVAAPATLAAGDCGLNTSLSFGSPPLFAQCGLSSSPGAATQLSVYVDAYCGVQIWPAGDAACAEPGAGYWGAMKLKAHYVAPDRIANSLSTPASSYLLELTRASSTSLTLAYWPATVNASAAGLFATPPEKTCSGTIAVVGNQVDGVPDTAAACPAGSYDADDLVDGCRPCPVGYTCPGGSTAPIACSADQFQPFLGQGDPGTCQQCNASADPRLTSEAGADYCTVPYIDTQCTDGHEYNADTTTCDECSPGTERMVGREEFCVPCEPGYYSDSGATDCMPCPLDQFAPVYGLAQQSAGDQKCLYCPAGSVAVTELQQVGQLGSTSCNSCDPGTFATFEGGHAYQTCAACPDGTYRSGDASPSNNACKPIPPGFKEANRTTVTYPRSQIRACSKGEVSYWANSARRPSSPEACTPCLGTDKYAPRTGMSSCQPCKAGTAPAQTPGLPGNDKCVPCVGNTYRQFGSSSPTCLVCTAGREVSSGNTDCVPCLAGHYMPDVANGTNTSLPAQAASCLPCPANYYQPLTGKAKCIACPAGTSTMDDGNTECQACPVGYFSPTAATPCIAAPPGSFVNLTSAKVATACFPGTFGADAGVEECDICAPGQYANVRGLTACKTCPSGTRSAAKAVTCTQCLRGYYSTAGSSSCIPCKPGAYTNTTGSSTCAACPRGKQCPQIGTMTPQPCPKGQYSKSEGSRLCTACPPETFQDATGQVGCKPCASGTTTRGQTGQSTCQPLRTRGRRMLRAM